MGTEGCLEASTDASEVGPTRPARNQLWMSGSLKKGDHDSKSVAMSYNFGGHLDYGCFYAANSFFDPLSQCQVVWGWIPEDDLCDDLRHAQGWSGMLSMPRELRMQTLQHVIGASASKLEDITSIECEADEYGSFTVRTLASQPVQSLVECLRRGSDVRGTGLARQHLSGCMCSAGFSSADIQTDKWELECSLQVSRDCNSVGLSISHAEDDSQSTTLTFFPRTETFTIDRPSLDSSHSSHLSKLINSEPETAPHTLFTSRDPVSDVEVTESLDIRVWRDNSVLEVFVNGRTAISTRLYAAEETFGMHFFAQDSVSAHVSDVQSKGSPTGLLYATLWDGIGID